MTTSYVKFATKGFPSQNQLKIKRQRFVPLIKALINIHMYKLYCTNVCTLINLYWFYDAYRNMYNVDAIIGQSGCANIISK